MAVMSLGAVVRFGEQMNALGQEANISEARFAALTETMGGYDAVMEAMRRATMGVVDDMAIQQNSMLLIQSAGIETTAELERMSNMIMRLKKPSEDATTAFQNFGLMLANNSILRLDSFGLSASRVRERIIQLTESGEAADRSEAFRMAVMEEGEKAMRRFGDSADAAGTAFSRFGTIAKNVQQDIAQNINAGVEGSAGLLELALGIHPTQVAEASRRAEQAAISVAMDTAEIVNQVMSGAGAGENTDFITNFVRRSLGTAKTNPELLSDVKGFNQYILDQMGAAGEIGPGDWFNANGSNQFVDITTQIVQLQAAREADRSLAAEVMTSQTEIADQAERRAAAEESVFRNARSTAELQERAYAAGRQYMQEQATMEGQRTQMTGTMDDLVRRGIETRGGEGNPNFLTAGAAEDMRGLANEAQRTLDLMLEMDKANDAMFTDEQLERAKSQADYMAGMADSAEEAAEAFKNMSLDEGLGREDGGFLGNMTDEIVKDLEAMQATADEIKRIQREFDLASGRETEAGAVWQDRISDIIAGVARNISVEQAVAMATMFEQVMKDAALRGVDTNNPEFSKALETAFATTTFGQAGAFDPTAFVDQFDPARQAAQDVQTAIADTAMPASEVSASMTTAALGAGDFAAATGRAESWMGKTADHTATIKSNMDEMSSKVHKLRIQPELVNIPNLITLLVPSLAQFVAANGGQSPGTSQRDSQSGLLDRSRDR